MKTEFSLKDIIDINQWQEIQDHFGEVIGVTIRIVDPDGIFLTTTSNQSRLYEEIVSSSPAAIAKYRRSLKPSRADLEQGEDWKEGYRCYMGLYNFSIPINLPNNQRIAYILVGPVVLGERQKPDSYREKAEELGIDLDKLIDALIEIKIFSFSGIQSVLELLQDVISYIVELDYHRYKLERIIPSPKLSKRIYKFYIEKLLNALLDVSFNITGAEFGSIMLLDEKAGDLYIKIARGIKKDIIKHTRLKIGEGIAGLAAQEKRFLLVDDKVTDERIKNRLHRPKIKSAIIAPIQVEDRLLGVMNIGTFHSTDRFNLENIDVLRQLVKLTTSAFQDISHV